MRKFGLIGKKLSHSFSKKYFESKFEREQTKDCSYNLYELPHIEAISELLEREPSICGLNVTIPYKEEIWPYIDEVDESAEKVGAVNVVKIINGKLRAYNSDYFGFKSSLEKWIDPSVKNALVLGTGGAAKAVVAALEDLAIHYILVSRTDQEGCLTYSQINKIPGIFKTFKLIVNTTPLGMYPNIEEVPTLPYDQTISGQYFFDLVYNPESTLFMQKGLANGAKVKNGLEMLQLQAEKAWEIWNT